MVGWRIAQALRGILWVVEVLRLATIYVARSFLVVDLRPGVNMDNKYIERSRKKQIEIENGGGPRKRWRVRVDRWMSCQARIYW